MKVLILGATGFIGGHIARAAIEAGWDVSCLRRDERRSGHMGGLPVNWILGNLMDPDSLQSAMDGVEVVFHAAAFYPKDGNPRKVQEYVNYAQGEINQVLSALEGSRVRRLVYTSTLTTIGHPPDGDPRLANERDFYIPGTLPKSAYYESKLIMEKAVIEASSDKLETVVLNPTAVFGPGDIYLTMGKLLIAVANGYALAWLPGEINAVDVRDVAQAHLAAVDGGTTGERYIIGGHNFSIKQALTVAAQVAEVRPPRFEIPLWILDGMVALGDLFPFIPLPSNHLRAIRLWQGYNTDKAREELGFSPRGFDETVRDSLEWFRSKGLLE